MAAKKMPGPPKPKKRPAEERARMGPRPPLHPPPPKPLEHVVPDGINPPPPAAGRRAETVQLTTYHLMEMFRKTVMETCHGNVQLEIPCFSLGNGFAGKRKHVIDRRHIYDI